MRKILQIILRWLARATLLRYHPTVVGVTGSVGKTSSRLAITSVLREKWRVGQTEKNLNNEIGLPLAILNESDSGYANLAKWAGILARAVRQIIIKNSNYPEVLVLEYGVDHSGDMDYLLSIARPQVAVVTSVSATHLKFFGTVEEVAKEKGKLVAALDQQSLAVLNYDFTLVAGMRAKTKSKVIGYGESGQADVRISGTNVSVLQKNDVQGMSFRLSLAGNTVPVFITGVVGKPVASYAAAAAAVGLGMGLSVLQITNGLKKFIPPAGRLRLIKGMGGSLIIDDTYNSSPQAALAALEILAVIPVAIGSKRWAVLGDMLELGSDSERLHYAVGQQAVASKVDFLVTVGQVSEQINKGALAGGLPADHSWHVVTTEEAITLLRQKLNSGDITLVKGSQAIRCERIVKGIMAEPVRASELLVRQDAPWV